ncbi:hypothetical protein llap_3443 [Limosa lapponica baueri]|uniref:Uncharacterized protein n=1 Tax=Limosa lapponica baueri TaxID=1758121 RepID=A0A2I0UJI5_LIMLA|nr:hypothetical protein llap_3443 [Limosa lapponica baueri]
MTLQTPKSVKEGGGGGAPGARAEIPLQPVEKTMVKQALPLQPVEDTMPEQVVVPKGSCDPIESPCWSKLLAGSVDPWRQEPTLEQVSWQDL